MLVSATSSECFNCYAPLCNIKVLDQPPNITQSHMFPV